MAMQECMLWQYHNEVYGSSKPGLEELFQMQDDIEEITIQLSHDGRLQEFKKAGENVTTEIRQAN